MCRKLTCRVDRVVACLGGRGKVGSVDQKLQLVNSFVFQSVQGPATCS